MAVLIAVFTELFGSYLGKYAVEVSANFPTVASFSYVSSYSPDECHSGMSSNRSRLFVVKSSSLARLSNFAVILRCVIPVLCRKTNDEVNFSHETQLW